MIFTKLTFFFLVSKITVFPVKFCINTNKKDFGQFPDILIEYGYNQHNTEKIYKNIIVALFGIA
jgi:hypothetical protein